MNASRIFVDTACILKRVNVGEADKIITVLTKKNGKIRVIAKGIRKISSRRGPHLDVFNIVRVTIHQGKTLDVLTEAVSLFSGRLTYNSWVKMRAAYLIVEIVDKLIPDHELQEAIYNEVERVLKEIGMCKEEDIEALLIVFLNTSLETLGFLSKEKYISNLSQVISFIERIVERKIRSSRFFLIQ